MVKRWIVVGVALLACLVVVGCGVPQDEHDAVVAERDAAKTKVASLESQLDEVESDLADAESQISSLESEIEVAEATIAELEAAIAAGEEEVAEEEVELSFEGAEYVNEEYGFSVKYPESWEEITPSHETFVFQVVGYCAACQAFALPGVAIIVVDIEEGVSSVDAYITILREIGHTNFEVVSESETALADGTPASIVILQYTHRDGYSVDALGLGVEKDGKHIYVFVYTVNALEPFSEEQMLEVAHTLTFE